jgi:hypothetical protein
MSFVSILLILLARRPFGGLILSKAVLFEHLHVLRLDNRIGREMIKVSLLTLWL